ncbi:hypothetical protein [Streptomyces sp. IBSBF 2435]|uniref:hypothetical protein n=1 Tax=Streptomyces sp. IBSBF 2435 TaxID=2903531 RepID=UPI002FDBF2D2
MAANGTLAKDDGAVQKALAALDAHVGAMRNAYNTADSINQSIAANYIADSSSAFQRQIEQWMQTCQHVASMFQTLQSDLQGASQQISSADENALHMSGFTGGSQAENYANILTGK